MSILEALVTFTIGGIIGIALLVWRICWTTRRDVNDAIGGGRKKW
ncbi:hypothetical protein LCGC14_1650310 [marine sediment metagenome]|uniref:Uncharacterized protein n=1 Tax=marine sediment metagenome TaxID=412755 RepID=A0A0F9KCT9_9ZZZZ